MKPEKTFRVGLCSASVFRNEAKSSDKTYLTVSIQRRYKDNGEWKSATNFGHAELPQVIRTLQLAQEFVESQEAEVAL